MPSLKTTLKSYILEALLQKDTAVKSVEDIVSVLEDCKSQNIDVVDSPNKIGKTIKFISPNVGSAFAFNDKVVHLSFTRE